MRVWRTLAGDATTKMRPSCETTDGWLASTTYGYERRKLKGFIAATKTQARGTQGDVKSCKTCCTVKYTIEGPCMCMAGEWLAAPNARGWGRCSIFASFQGSPAQSRNNPRNFFFLEQERAPRWMMQAGLHFCM